MKEKKEIFRNLFVIAIPIALQNLINVGVSVTDTLMIGNIGEVQLSGVSQANQVFFLLMALICGTASGAIVLTAQYWGKGETEPICTIIGLVIRIGVFCGIAVGAFVIIRPDLVMMIFTDSPEVAQYGEEYLRIIGFSYAFSSFTGVYLTSLRSVHIVKASTCIYLLAFLLNIFLNYIFIFGHFGVPRMEVRGAAIATLISRIVEAALVCIYMYRVENKVHFTFGKLFRKSRQYWRAIIRYSLPVLFSELNWAFGISIQAALIGHLGVNVLAACSFINVVQQVATIAIVGIGSAAGIIVGNMIGAGEDQKAARITKVIFKFCFLLAFFCAGVILLFRPIAPNFINATPETARLIKEMLFVSAYLVFFQSFTIPTLGGILRSSGDTVFCAAVDVVTMWVLKVGIGLLITTVWELNPVLVYFILCSDELVKTFITLARLKSGKWIYHTTG